MAEEGVDARLRRLLRHIQGDEVALDLVVQLVDALDERRQKAVGTGVFFRRMTSKT